MLTPLQSPVPHRLYSIVLPCEIVCKHDLCFYHSLYAYRALQRAAP